MAYGQTNYSEKMGNGPYTIAEIGCFLTAFCNLAERFGQEVTPPALNSFFDNGHYLADPADGAGVKDDLSYNSVTAYNSQIVVTGQGSSGWPNSNNAIVKFHYRSISNPTLSNGQPNMIDHFCLVADHAAGTIVDSWDGVVKKPGAYGSPVGWATYGGPVVQAVSPPPAPAAAAASDVLGNVNIAGLSLSAAMKSDLAGGMSVVAFNAKYSATAGFQPIATSRQLAPAPAPAPAPSIPEVPAPAPAPAAPNITYTKLATPLDLVTNKQPTNWWELGFKDDAHATAAAQLSQGTPFLAYGMAQRNDGDRPAYYMIQEDFGNADTTGTPNNNNGVNTVDLSPAPTPAPAPAADPAPAAETPAPAPAAPAAPAASDSESVPVTVSTWQSSYKAFLSPQQYMANTSVKVEDLAEEHDDVELLKGQNVSVAGIFDKDGVRYFRTAKSVQSGVWYGVPVTALTRIGTAGDDDEIDKIMDDIKKDGSAVEKTLSTHDKAVASVASAEGFIERLFHRNKKGK